MNAWSRTANSSGTLSKRNSRDVEALQPTCSQKALSAVVAQRLRPFLAHSVVAIDQTVTISTIFGLCYQSGGIAYEKQCPEITQCQTRLVDAKARQKTESSLR